MAGLFLVPGFAHDHDPDEADRCAAALSLKASVERLDAVAAHADQTLKEAESLRNQMEGFAEIGSKRISASTTPDDGLRTDHRENGGVISLGGSAMPDGRDGIVGVHLGIGGNPLILGLPVFAVASVALGMGLMGKPTGLPPIVPLIIFTTGLYQLVTTVWAIFLGQSIVATIFALFSGFWLSLAALLLGLQHNWYGIAADKVAASEELFFISYTILFVFLTIPCLRLPVIYPLMVILVALAVALVAAGLPAIAGYVCLTFSFLAFWAWMNVALTEMGVTSVPPLGPRLWS